MSSHATIAIQNEDGTVDAVQVYYHGYPTGVGAILCEYFTNEESIRDLLSYGDISTLSPYNHNCVFFHRDKKEPLHIYEHVDLEDINNQEYNYLFIDGRWVWDEGELLEELQKELAKS